MFCVGNRLARLELTNVIKFPYDTGPKGIVAMDDGLGFLVGNKFIYSMNFLEKIAKKIHSECDGLYHYHALALFPGGNFLAVIDRLNSMFSVFTSYGSPFYSRRIDSPSGIIVSPDGSKIFIYTGRSGIMVFDATDKVNFRFLFQIGTRGREIDNFMGERYMAFDKDGKLIVSDSCNNCSKVIDIEKPSSSFPVVKLISNEMLKSQGGITLSKDTYPILVVVGYHFPSNHQFSQLFLFDYSSGNLLHLLDCKLNYPHSIAITSDGNLTVCEYGWDSLKIFEFCVGCDPKIVSESSSCMPKSDKGVPLAGGGVAAMHNSKKTSLANYAMSRHVIPAGVRAELSKLCNSDDTSSDSD